MTVSRLIKQFIPNNYDLSIEIDAENSTFRGSVAIKGATTGPKPEVRLHSKDLNIISVTLSGKEAKWRHDADDELVISHPEIMPGEHIIMITYDGKITDAMHGLYPAYFEHDGKRKKLFATQFESHHAREVFPCVDEPQAKATFDLTLTTAKNITVLGNQPINWQRVENDKLVTNFQTTPVMSTYLLAWVAGEMHFKSTKTKSGVEVSVWATPAQSPESLEFALDIAKRTIEFYEDYFDTPYPLPKSDHVALPDFSSGAMENWGLVTYREIALLADPKSSSISSKQYIATVIAHELAHMWFGNLVTMEWWDDLWLNESFATMVEYLAVDHLYPEWNIWLDFSTNETVIALRRDSIDGVQSVKTDVHHPDEISTLFDGAIVYAKGARLLRMLHHYLGDKAFRSGLKEYFKKHAYKNTTGQDLWDALSKASGEDVGVLMNPWLTQSGFPVLSVEKNGQEITLSQKQFFIGEHESSDRIWPIPLNSPCSEMPKLLTEKTTTVTRHHTTPLRFNAGDSAHFITNYSKDLLSQLIKEVSVGNFSPIDRLQLLHESTLLARGGVMSSSQLIPIIDAYKNETSEPVWSMVALALAELRKFVEDDKNAEHKLRKLSGELARSEYLRLGWDPKPGESEEDGKLRSTIIGMTLYSEDDEAIQKAKDIYTKNNLESINPELRPIILGSVTRNGDDAIVDELLEIYKTTQNAEIAQDITFGITSTRSNDKINQLLEAIKQSDIVRPQDATRWFAYLIRGRESRDQAWEWIRDNWDWVVETFSGDKSYDYYPQYAAAGLTTAKQLKEYKDFFAPKQSIPALKRVITLGISEIEARVELIERDGPDVRRKLSEL